MPDAKPAPVLSRTRYGTAHAERVESALWEKCIREAWSGYALEQHLGVARQVACRNFSHSSYRDTDPGPFWSWQRFGRTSTLLPDGRVIHVAGEHEDDYDPDFCIYNDVTIEHPDGRWEFYLYPKDVFPPTDFHSATLIGHDIILIGSLGYRDMRRPGETQVLKLDIHTLHIEGIATTGDGPGWISRHVAERTEDAAILIAGGHVQTESGYQRNAGLFELDLTTRIWRRREHGDRGLFPISVETYRACKNPRYGVTNPERSSNPFWLEMARRQWPPSRARLHYGDVAPVREKEDPSADGPLPASGTPEFTAWVARLSARVARQKLARPINDVVWTAMREECLRMALPDGRRLLIGGEVRYYGDEEADAWAYNDIVVTGPGNVIEILTYPKDVFPHFYSSMTGVLHKNKAYLFGIVDEDRQVTRRRGLSVLRLDLENYQITELPIATPPPQLNVYDGSATCQGSRVVLPLSRQNSADPELGVALDLESLTWSAPFPYAHPPEQSEG